MRHRLAFYVLVALCIASSPAALASTTWYVNGVTGSDSNNCMSAQTACRTIGHAISLAASGDAIMVAAATYTENLTIGTSLNVIGAGAATTILDGNATGRVITISGGNAQITFSNITIRNGNGKGSGGGIYNSGTLTVNYSTISGNGAGISSGNGSGGGVYNSGTLTVNYSTISGNSIGAPIGGCGGGIYNSGRLTLNATTLTQNSAFGYLALYGGGICNASSGTATVNNSTLGGNGVACGNILHRCSAAAGGGIFNVGILVINNTTVSGNGAGESWGNFVPQGGGIYNGGSGRVSLQNSVLADNHVSQSGNHHLTAPSNCHGAMTSNGYNMSKDGTCSFHNSGDRINTDPMLGPLQNNGGPTLTMALPSGSPAIDAGNPSGCTDGSGHLLTTDQRGYPRHDPEDTGGCDMGAYENQTGVANFQPLPVDLLKEHPVIGFGSGASANACRPLGSSCTRGLTGQCCVGMCGYRSTCCDKPLRNEICASNAECCSGFCYKPPPSGIGRCM